MYGPFIVGILYLYCITLLSQVLKLLERVLDARIRRRVEGDFGEEQQGFREGR